MGLNTILKIFTPKNKIFYDYFEKMVDRVEERTVRDVLGEAHPLQRVGFPESTP